MDSKEDAVHQNHQTVSDGPSIILKSENKKAIDSILESVVTPSLEARMATDEEFFSNFDKIDIGSTSAIDRGGVVVYSDKVSALVDSTDGQILVTGASGALKSTFIVIPSIYAQARAGENMFIADCKGEIYDHTRWILEQLGYNILKIDLRRPENSVSWNPLLKPYYLYRSGDPKKVSEAVEMVEYYAQALSPPRSLEDPFWDEAGSDLLKGGMIILFRICDDPRQVTLRNLLSIFSFMVSQRDGFDLFYKSLDPLDNIRTFTDIYYQNAEKTGNCIMQMARKAIIPFATNEYISSILVDDDIDFRKMLTEKTAVFICVPDEKTSYHSIVSMFVQQMYASLVSMASELPDHRLPIRFNLILDEFASFPSMQNIAEMVSACRSRNIRIMFIIQALSQLKSKYGDDTMHTILGNCTTNFFLNSREEDMLSYYSFLCGQGRDGKPLMDAYRLQRLSKEKGEALVLFGREHPYITNLVRFSEWAKSPEDWAPIEKEHGIQPLETIDVMDRIHVTMAGPIFDGESESEDSEDDYLDLTISCDSKDFDVQRVCNAINMALKSKEGSSDYIDLSYAMLEQFVFFAHDKEKILDFLEYAKDEVDFGTLLVADAYKDAKRKIRLLSQEQIDSIRRIIVS